MKQHKIIDYAFKAKVLEMGLDKVERSASLKRYKSRDWGEYMAQTMEYADKGLIREWQEAQKINDASYHRRKRLQVRVKDLLINEDGEYQPSTFLTLTFNDDTLNNTTPKQRRERVQRFLKGCGVKYIANIDFGAKNGREHYHAIIQSQSVNYMPWRKNGNINGEKIRLQGATSVKLAKYISKLTNHGIKETTHRQALIYSR